MKTLELINNHDGGCYAEYAISRENYNNILDAIGRFDKKIINELKPFNEKNRKKSILIEIDIEKFQSDFINIVLDMIHIDFYEIFLLHPESKYPSNADIYKRKLNSSVIIEAIFLGDMNNLLIVPKENGFTVNHFNKRFTANDLGSNYFTEWE